MSDVRRVFVEKKEAFSGPARDLASELRSYLGIASLEGIRILIRYDVEHISEETFVRACRCVFAEPPVDTLYLETFPAGPHDRSFSVEYLPGQFDQRADSAEQCIRFLNENETPIIRSATTYVIQGQITDQEFDAIKSYCINPVDSREADPKKSDTLEMTYPEPEDIRIFTGLTTMNEEDLKALYDSLNLAMTFRDFIHIQNYFASEEHRDPSVTEVRVLDTYWSDHCRHTTFSTELKEISFEDGFYRPVLEESCQSYLQNRKEVYPEGDQKHFVCLMDLALLAMKKLKKEGKLTDQEESDEINACSIVVPVEIDGQTEEWLVNFKNETHNHPTEIEPFGGAATCLGGAIRDPLSGRTYVYQAMRVTGAADPRASADQTLKGKLPQVKLVREAAHGYSSYGNQIGLATGYVKEIYHPAYVAKRMEIGAVMGAAPRSAVQRLTSDPGDIIILLGGRTGRDGIGGATGSSKVHTVSSIEVCGAEVQKGNAPTERKLQRMFRRPEVSRLIKKCNDFGAGGVSVAIGELADGLMVDLDKVPKKYAGLDGTELAISESQERMAVVVDPKDVDAFLRFADEENLEATCVAVVTKEPRLRLTWRGKEIVNLSRAFLDTNGAHQETNVRVEMPSLEENYFARKKEEAGAGGETVRQKWLHTLASLNCCSQKGLVEMFDSSIGAGSVLMPYGGKYQLTETQVMVAKLPVLEGKTDTVTMMSYGFDPYLSSWSPYHGAIYAVLESIARIVSAGGDYRKIRFTFQEYFRRMSEDPARWSQPFAALLGAYEAQMRFGLPSIGGKDSMSGTFQDIDVPPTLVSFAVDIGNLNHIVSPELKQAGDTLVLLSIPSDAYDLPDFEEAKQQYAAFYEAVVDGKIKAAYALDGNGLAAALTKMALGNGLGVNVCETWNEEELFTPGFGSIVAEIASDETAGLPDNPDAALQGADLQIRDLPFKAVKVGSVTDDAALTYGSCRIPLSEACQAWSSSLEKVFRTRSGENVGDMAGEISGHGSDGKEEPKDMPGDGPTAKAPLLEREQADGRIDETGVFHAKDIYVCSHKVARPRVFIPVFPGTNCEYDSARAFARAGADTDIRVFRNLRASDIRESVDLFANAIDQAQIIMFPGGFSAGDEPDGSAKFFATAFQNEKIRDAVHRLLDQRDGLILGICNGFQALIKLGLVPEGHIVGQTETSPTLTFNTIGRHISKMVYTKVMTDKSPWLAGAKAGEVYVNPASHGEGRFVASREWIARLMANGQIATMYADPDGNVSMDEEWNVNGSYACIEGITSPDGRVLGKMCHSERRGDGVAINICGEQDMKIFESGVKYYE